MPKQRSAAPHWHAAKLGQEGFFFNPRFRHTCHTGNHAKPGFRRCHALPKRLGCGCTATARALMRRIACNAANPRECRGTARARMFCRFQHQKRRHAAKDQPARIATR